MQHVHCDLLDLLWTLRLEGALLEEANGLPMEGIAESNAEGTADATLGAGLSIQVEEPLQEDLRPVPVSRLEAAFPAPVPRRAQAKGRWPLRRKTSLEEPQAPSPDPGVLGFASKEDAEKSLRAWLRREQGDDREPDQGDDSCHAQNGVGEGAIRAVTGGGPNNRLLQPLPKQQARTSFASAASSHESVLHDEVAAQDSADSAQSGSTSGDLEASESLEVNSSEMELRQQTPHTDLETEEVFREIQKREQEHPPQKPHLSQIGHRQHWLDLIEHRVLQQVVVSEFIAEPGGHAVRARSLASADDCCSSLSACRMPSVTKRMLGGSNIFPVPRL